MLGFYTVLAGVASFYHHFAFWRNPGSGGRRMSTAVRLTQFVRCAG